MRVTHSFLAFDPRWAETLIEKSVALHAAQGLELVEHTDERIPLSTTGRLHRLVYREGGEPLSRAQTAWEIGLC